MKAAHVLKVSFLRVSFLMIITISMTSCKKAITIENSLKNETFTKTEKEETEAFFFITTANVSKSIISKSQIAQQKSSDFEILELSKRIENHQNDLLLRISEMANKRLVIITEINATHQQRDLYDLIDANNSTFDKVYVDSMISSLKEQIGLFEQISKETNDQKILKLVLQFLPEHYTILREMQEINNTII